MDIVAIICQIGGALLWPILHLINYQNYPENQLDKIMPHPWAIPIGLFLTSCGWWECYVDESPQTSRYDLILGKDFLVEVGIDIINSRRVMERRKRPSSCVTSVHSKGLETYVRISVEVVCGTGGAPWWPNDNQPRLRTKVCSPSFNFSVLSCN